MSAVDREMAETFVYETEEMLRSLDETVARNEGADSLSAKDTNELFRIMHTIKGSAAMLRLDALAATAHRLEDVFSLLRSGRGKTGAEAMKRLFEALLAAMKYFQSAADALMKDIPSPQPPAELAKLAETALAALGGTPGERQTAPAAVANEAWTEGACRARVVLKPSALPCARALVVLRAAAQLCEKITSLPSDLEKHPELAGELTKKGFTAAFMPKAGVKPEAVAALIRKNLHTASCELEAKPRAAAGGAEKLLSVRQSQLFRHQELLEELLAAQSLLEARLIASQALDAETGKLLQRLRDCTTSLNRSAEAMNMAAVEGIFFRLRMIARDMCAKLGKDAAFVCTGGSVDVDRNMLDELYDPLMHMVRNAFDHGVETKEQRRAAGKPERASVKIEVSKLRGGCVRVTVTDDGAGIDAGRVFARAQQAGLVSGERSAMTDREVYALLLRPGFSMAEKVSEYSGRGVGLDVVNTRVKKLGGSIAIESKPGRGSIFTLTLPVQRSVIDALEVEAAGFRLLVPLNSVAKVLTAGEFEAGSSRREDGTQLFDGTKCHYADLGLILADRPVNGGLVLLCDDEETSAVRVDKVLQICTITLKPLPRLLRDIKIAAELYAGCALRNDGRVSLVLSTDKLYMATGKAGA